MKKLLLLMMVFWLALCIAAPTKVNASVFDDDVGMTITQGFTLTQGVLLTNLREVADQVIAPMTTLQSKCPPSLPISCKDYKECPNRLRSLTYWHGGDSKASRCGKAYNVNHNRATTSLKYNSTKYGKGNKRLSCEAQA